MDSISENNKNSVTAVREFQAPKMYVGTAINEPEFEKKIKNDLISHSLNNISQLTISSKPIDDNHAATKA